MGNILPWIYAEFLDRATDRDVLGQRLRVAAVEDILRGKVWTVQDETRRPSKRPRGAERGVGVPASDEPDGVQGVPSILQKDLADIARLLEARPDLESLVPASVLARLV